jgi:hypothetical protein
MTRVLALGDRRLLGLRAGGAEVILVDGPAAARAALAGAETELGLLILTAELARGLDEWLTSRPRLLWTVAAP